VQKYDLLVIGSGPAGEKAAAQAAYFDKRVAIIEANIGLGGVCVNTAPSRARFSANPRFIFPASSNAAFTAWTIRFEKD